MDLRRFITLKTVVEEGSFLRASQKLCCTQSTVTFHIQQLEQEFSVQLFEKIGRRMCLTREGKKLLPHIYELTRVMDTLREAAKKESDPDGELRVVSGETLLSYRMPQVLQRFRQRAPKVRLSLQSLNCYVIRDALLNDEADVGVFYRVGNDDALNRRELGEQSLVLVASPQIADVDFTEPGRHNACSFIINEPQCVFRQIFESTLRQRRITVETTIELLSIESIKRCVAANIGVSYLPRFAVEKELESGELIELPFGEQSQPLRQCAHIMLEKRLARRCTFLFSVLKSVFCRDKNNAGLKPGIEITLLSFAVARPFRLVYGAYQYFWYRDGVFSPAASLSL
ncbi:LysR family transcriptional regulator [Escherichia coli]|uniref:LysR family transcriptional regulator n=26 Tax=root TaxID=1 RepID=A0ABC8DXD9_ECOLX|nr:LysR family transcriptional regulator [Escherichia coli]BCG30892.1 LysR family transcriptional regulator [Escherichia coli]BCG35958.1 LysR family transcriptional regulator [Escherichia coli]SRY10713.1 transcriptional regulator YfiE [Escherichia coli]